MYGDPLIESVVSGGVYTWDILRIATIAFTERVYHVPLLGERILSGTQIVLHYEPEQKPRTHLPDIAEIRARVTLRRRCFHCPHERTLGTYRLCFPQGWTRRKKGERIKNK